MNLKNKVLPAIATLGIVIAVMVAVQSGKKRPPAQPITQPAQAPFKSYIGGAGIVEASSNNINIGTSLPGLVKTVWVVVGDRLNAGDHLFQIDDRELQAELLNKLAGLAKTQSAVEEAKATLEDARSQYDLVRSATNGRAVSIDDVQKRRYAELLARARLESAKTAVVAADADVKFTKSSIERLTVRAPIPSGHAGQYSSGRICSDRRTLHASHNAWQSRSALCAC